MQITRQYHSTALLLADGRVLSSGGGLCDTCDRVGYLGKNAEVFTPPYLFKRDGSGDLAPRPVIASAPGTVRYGTTFTIEVPQAASIQKVALIRLSAVTHSVNMEQRYDPLTVQFFCRRADGYRARQRQHRAARPLHAGGRRRGRRALRDADGHGGRQQRAERHSPQPTNGATFTAPAFIALAADASDPDGSVAKVEFFNGTTKLGEDSSVPYTFAWTDVSAGSYAFTARATDNLGVETLSTTTALR